MPAEQDEAAVSDRAASGVVALTGHPDGPPLVPPGAAAGLARRIGERLAVATRGTAHPLQVDGAALLAERAAFTDHRRRGRVSGERRFGHHSRRPAAGGDCRLLPTADGWAAVSCARPDDPPLPGALVGAELPADPWPADPWPGVAAWLRAHTGADLAERAALLGLDATTVRRPAAAPLPVPGRPRDIADLPLLLHVPLAEALARLTADHVAVTLVNGRVVHRCG